MTQPPRWQPLRRWVLIDSAGYFALIDSREADHAVAAAVARGLQAAHWRVFTTNFVIAEAHALLLNRLGHSWAARFLIEVAASQSTSVVRARAADERRARAVIARYDDKDFSLTDAISFAVMERLGIPFAFTFDQHFAQYGWTVLTPGHF
jgi:predicted nucleic acid-binding protein